jgi:hypothetical protein
VWPNQTNTLLTAPVYASMWIIIRVHVYDWLSNYEYLFYEQTNARHHLCIEKDFSFKDKPI